MKLFRYINGYVMNGCSKTSVFGTVSLDLMEKPGFCRFFQEIVSNPTGVWNNLTKRQIAVKGRAVCGPDRLVDRGHPVVKHVCSGQEKESL
jgi:hypothetical protein